jgi:hypothetical protein
VFHQRACRDQMSVRGRSQESGALSAKMSSHRKDGFVGRCGSSRVKSDRNGVALHASPRLAVIRYDS